MMVFWLLALGLCLLAAAFILLPGYWFTGQYKCLDDLDQRHDMNVTIFTERLQEYQAKLDQGLIEATVFRQLKLELERNLLADSEVKTQTKLLDRQGLLPLACALLVPVFAVLAYADMGFSWGAISDVELAKELQQLNPQDVQDISVGVVKLVKSLEQQPENDGARFLLASYYRDLGQFDKSLAAFKILLDRFPQDANLAIHYAEAVYSADNQQLTARVRVAIDRALSLNPNEIYLLEFKTLAALRAGDLEAALGFFHRALAVKPDDKRVALLQQIIIKVQDTTKVKPDLDANIEKTQAQATNLGPGLQVLVEVADHIQVASDTPIFVFARAMHGSAMPLAIQRLTRGALPQLIHLDESMAMLPNMRINNFDKVQVVARISTSGTAKASPEDYEALSEPLDPNLPHGVIKLMIEHQRRDFQK